MVTNLRFLILGHLDVGVRFSILKQPLNLTLKQITAILWVILLVQ